MAKVDIDIVADVLKHNELDEATVDRIVRQLTRAAQKAADEEAADREPPVPKQWVILLSDPRNELPDQDMVGWVLQLPENENPGTTTERLIRAAHAFNTTKRGRKQPAKSLAETCEIVGGRFLKEERVVVKTKLPVTVLKTDNVLPSDTSEKITMADLRRR